MFFRGKPVGIQSSSRDAFGHQSCIFFGAAFGQSGSSPAPILQFLPPVANPRKSLEIYLKNSIFAEFWHVFGWFSCFPTGQKVMPKTAKLVEPDWIPTGRKRCQKMQNWCPTASRLDPDWIPTGSMDWEEPALTPIFPFPDPPLPLFFPCCAPAVHQYLPPAPKRQKQS